MSREHGFVKVKPDDGASEPPGLGEYEADCAVSAR